MYWSPFFSVPQNQGTWTAWVFWVSLEYLTSQQGIDENRIADAPFPGALSSVAGNSPPSSYYRLPDALCIQHL